MERPLLRVFLDQSRVSLSLIICQVLPFWLLHPILITITLCFLFPLMPFYAFRPSQLSLSHTAPIFLIFLYEGVQQFRSELNFYCLEILPFFLQLQIYQMALLQLRHSFASVLVLSFIMVVWETLLGLVWGTPMRDQVPLSFPLSYLGLPFVIDMPSFAYCATA